MKIKTLRPARLRDLIAWSGNNVLVLDDAERAECAQLIREHVQRLSQTYDVPQKQDVDGPVPLPALQDMESNLAVILSGSWRRRSEDGLTMQCFLEEAGVEI